MRKREGIMMCVPFTWERFEKWGMKAFVQPKLNGERCRAIFDSEGNLNLRSSYNEEFVSVPHIREALLGMKLYNVELDGELYIHGMDLRSIQSIVSRKVNIHPGYRGVKYHVFDIVKDEIQAERISFLNRLSSVFSNSPVSQVPYDVCTSSDYLSSLLSSYRDQGYEGIVARKIDGIYQRGLHSTQIMKIKPREEDEYLIVGVEEEISIHGEPKGALGSFICSVNGEATFNVGSGSLLTRAGREKYWADKPIGKTLVVKYQELTPRGIPYCPVAVEII